MFMLHGNEELKIFLIFQNVPVLLLQALAEMTLFLM